MIRLQRWESGPYLGAFSLHIPDMRVEIARICARSPIVSIKPMFRYRTPSVVSRKYLYSISGDCYDLTHAEHTLGDQVAPG